MNNPVPYKTSKPSTFTVVKPIIKVIGLGGGGCNAVNRMIELGLSGIEYIAANTDKQALRSSLAAIKIQIGPDITRGLGSGGDPKIGEAAAEESYRELSQALVGADMVFLTAGMGGGTGSGSIPVATKIARSLGAVTVAIVTTPFSFEMGRRQRNSQEGLEKLRHYSDTLITVPNDRLLQIAPSDLPLEMAFRLADDVLRQGIQGITELITQSGMINVDFSHIRTMMQNGGGSLLSIGIGHGEHKALEAVQKALNHPLLDSIPLDNAAGIIANFTGADDLTFFEVAEALTYLQEKTNMRAEIVPGITNDERMEDRAQVILVITGLGATPVDRAMPRMIERSEPSANPGTAPASNPQPRTPTVEYAATPSNMDLPAFLRKRIR